MDAIVGLSGVLVAWFVLMIAGYLVARAWGAGGATGLLCAMPVSFALIALWAMLQTVTHIRFSLITVAWAFLLTVLAGWLVTAFRRYTGRVSTRRSVNSFPVLCAFVLMGTTVATAVVMLVATGGTFETSSQSFDVSSHANAVRWIHETGIASPLTTNGFVTGGFPSYYPTGFGSVAATMMSLLGSDAVLACNITATLLAGALWPSAMVLLARLVLGGSRRVIASTALLSLGLWGMPWAGMGWGVVWPTVAAAAYIPVMALGVLLLFRPASSLTGRLGGAALAAAGALATTLFHPRGLFLALPLFIVISVVTMLQRVGAARRHGGVPIVRLAVGLVVTALALIGLAVASQLTTSRKIVAINWPITEDFWGALLGYLLNGPNHTVPGVAVGLLIVVGAWQALLRADLRWIPISYVLLILLDVATSTVRDETLGSITQFWYNDRYRSAAMAPVAGVLLAVVGARYVWRLLLRRRLRRPMTHLIATAGVVVVGVSSMIGPIAYLSDWYINLSRDTQHNLVSPREVAFYREVAAIVPPDDIILNNPLDGSALIYAYVNRRLAFYINPAPATRDSRILSQRLVTTTDHTLVCTWFTESHIGWVYNGGVTYSTFATTPSPAPGMQIPDGFWATTLVAESGDAKLYQVTGCG